MSRDVLSLVRPKHWLKNVFVLAPLVFAEPADLTSATARVAVAFAVFCLLSSAVYCINDVLDRDADRNHPRKRLRPVASGRIPVAGALAVGGLLLASGLALALVTLPAGVSVVAGLYLANNVAYTTFLKHRVIVDVISIAFGFVLRLLAGAHAVPAEPSSWLLVCGFAISLLLGLGKRRAELGSVGASARTRPSLRVYTSEKLDVLLSTAASLTLLSYMLYTVSAETQELHGTDSLVYTTPLVAYGVFRFIFKAQEARGDGPVEILSADLMFPTIGVMWAVSVLIIIRWL